jgi:hypothetical protein
MVLSATVGGCAGSQRQWDEKLQGTRTRLDRSIVKKAESAEQEFDGNMLLLFRRAFPGGSIPQDLVRKKGTHPHYMGSYWEGSFRNLNLRVVERDSDSTIACGCPVGGVYGFSIQANEREFPGSFQRWKILLQEIVDVAAVESSDKSVVKWSQWQYVSWVGEGTLLYVKLELKMNRMLHLEVHCGQFSFVDRLTNPAEKLWEGRPI